MNKEENNINLFAFWEYDLYPYMLGAKATKMNSEGKVYLPSYQGWVKPFKLLPVKPGKVLYKKVEALRASHRLAEQNIKDEYTKKLLDVVPFHPKAKAK